MVRLMITKNIFKSIFALGVTLFFASSCSNREVEFDDYGLTTVCFPYQTPARTLILGDYDQGINVNDNNHCFEIGVVMSGVYSNDKDRYVHFEISDELLENVSNVIALPKKYYEVQTESPVRIPAGDTKGRIMIKLNDSFFASPLSVAPKNSTNYVVPVMITGVEGIDSLLVGKPAVDNPRLTVKEDWEVSPKNYTLFGIKYINRYEAYYLRHGVDKLFVNSQEAGETVYQNEFIERDELVKLTTIDYSTIKYQNRIRIPNSPDAGNIDLKLVFDENDKCSVQKMDGTVIGTGEFKKGTEEWGGKPRNAIYLKYNYNEDDNPNNSHEVSETLVVRDRDIAFESFGIINK